MGHQDREEDLDEIFKAYQRYLLTTRESEGEKISFRYDDNKIENFENIKKK